MCKIVVVFLFFTSNSFAQISVDSLLTNLNTSYNIIGTREYLLKNFIQFESADKREVYDVYFDSTNQLSEYIGLSIVHYSYDTKNRVTLIEGFNSKGERRYWDFPVKTIFTYFEDTTIVLFDSLFDSLNLNSNQKYFVRKSEELNNNAKYDLDRYKVLTKDSLILIEFSIWKKNNKISHNRKYVSYTFKQFDSIYKNEIISERFYDSTLTLINAETIWDFPYAYTEISLDKGKRTLINFFNKDSELVYADDLTRFERPISIDSPVNVRKRKFFRFKKN